MASISRAAPARSRRAWARVISGISRLDSADRMENGKNKSGSAMPFSAPYWDTAAARSPRYSARHSGIRLASAACSTLARMRLPSTGSTMPASSRRVKGGCFASRPVPWLRSPASRRANSTISRQETASLTVLPASTAAQAYPAPQPSTRRSASQTTPMRTSCSTSWATALGSTRRRARKHPRSAPATAITGRLGARICKLSAPRTSCST